jgi:hypothetical protein
MCAYSVILCCQQKSKHPIGYRRSPNWATGQLGDRRDSSAVPSALPVREVLVLFSLKDLTAWVCQISAGSVKSRLNRTRSPTS